MRSLAQTRCEVTPRPDEVRQRLQSRRWAVMVRYPIWDDEWIRRLSDVDARTLLLIFEATRRLERGDYGVCVRCCGPIEAQRLSETPEVPICAVCATFTESDAPSDTPAPAP